MNSMQHSFLRIIRLCWISWTPAATPRPPRRPLRHLLPRSSRVTRPVLPHPPTLHPKTTVTTVLTSQVSVWTWDMTGCSHCIIFYYCCIYGTCLHIGPKVSDQDFYLGMKWIEVLLEELIELNEKFFPSGSHLTQIICGFFYLPFNPRFFPLCRLPACRFLPPSFPKAAFYFQHRQQFIFPGELKTTC